MLFVDETTIKVKAGDGGQGCESFYRDLSRAPLADGGDGGKGGDIIIQASRSNHTLLDFKYHQHFKATKGGNASSNNKTGKCGEDRILKVPVGTIIRDAETGLLIKDLNVDGQQIIVAKGGRGGIGNQYKHMPKPPEMGEERKLLFELKVMADVGLVGFPNVGKSTIISAISKVKSPVANYPFTTKQPILGIVQDELDEKLDFVVADLPGIIEGAHQGRGLGDKFLKHAERTKILVHVLDMAGVEGRDPLEDFEKLNYELNSYGESLPFKSQIVVANKMDLPEAKNHLKRFKKHYNEPIIAISAQEKKGLDQLVERIKAVLCPECSSKKSKE
ncbi:MAG: Obg family GTPase CgtA [Candidatus Omnitrophica bacterium]|nr:Obg family GTPase CgtA [Candidatus Omnitrophota bacterium]